MEESIVIQLENIKLIKEFIDNESIIVDNLVTWNLLIPLYQKVKEKMTHNNCAMIHFRQWHDVEGGFISLNKQKLLDSCIAFIEFYNKRSKNLIGKTVILHHDIVFWYDDGCIELEKDSKLHIKAMIINDEHCGSIIRTDGTTGKWRIVK